MHDWFLSKHKEFRGRWTIRMMTAVMKSEWGGLGSFGTVIRLAHECGFRQGRPRLLPILNEATMKARLLFATNLLQSDNPLRKNSSLVIHIDEKWFIWHKLKHQVWIGPGEETPSTS